MGCADTASWQYGRPAGVTLGFQPLINIVKPPVGNCACNLLSKDACRAALADEVEPDGEKVAFVFFTFLLAGGAERLARGATRPNRSVCGPSCKLQGKLPSGDSGEEVALCVVTDFIGFNFRYAAGIHVAVGYKAISHHLADHGGRFGIEFVVVVHDGYLPNF